MEEDLVYWRHPSVPCIKIEEISEGNRYKGKAWFDAARQIYCENGKDEYRDIGHYPSGAPFLYGADTRVSISHCPGMFVVATLAPTPDADLAVFSPETALGVDVEPRNRAQVKRLRDRFLNDDELALIPADDTEANVLAWTIKEACYKAALTPGLDFRSRIIINRLPKFGPSVPVYDKEEYDYSGQGQGFTMKDYGKAGVVLPSGEIRTDDLFLSFG